VDFIVLEEPKVEINPAYKERKLKEGNESVHFEIGNIFNALQKITGSMQIKRFGILNGNIVLHNLAPNKTTISIGGVNFTAKEFIVLPDKTNKQEQDVDAGNQYQYRKQDISLLKGTTEYVILRFIDTEEKLISIDSFKISGKSTHTTNSIIERILKFKLYNTDFNALYDRI
jgi:hypothetical protein